MCLRLGKIIQQKLPGADIVFTRSDTRFIPLEDRTRIATRQRRPVYFDSREFQPDTGAWY